MYDISTLYVYYSTADAPEDSDAPGSSESPIDKITNFNKIEAEFARITTQIKEILLERNISVDELIEQLCSTSAVHSKKVPIFDEGISEKVKSLDELWKKLTRFWNIFDYDILILVIKLTKCTEAQKILDDFLAKIDVEEHDLAVLHYEIFEEKLTQPVLRVKVNVERCTVGIIEKIKLSISKKFELEKYSLRLTGIKEGCVEFFYDISKAVMSYLLEFKVSGSIMADFAAQSIVFLQISDDIKLNIPTEKFEMVRM